MFCARGCLISRQMIPNSHEETKMGQSSHCSMCCWRFSIQVSNQRESSQPKKTCRGPFEPLLFCDSVIWDWGCQIHELCFVIVIWKFAIVSSDFSWASWHFAVILNTWEFFYCRYLTSQCHFVNCLPWTQVDILIRKFWWQTNGN